MRGRSNRLVMDRTSVHGSISNRYGVLRCMDVHMVRGGSHERSNHNIGHPDYCLMAMETGKGVSQ